MADTIIMVGVNAIINADSSSLEKIKGYLDTGQISQLYVVCKDTASRKHRRAVLSRLTGNRSWLVGHLLFRLDTEKSESFIKRVCFTYNITHAIDVYGRGLLSIIASTPELRGIHLNKWASNDAADYSRIHNWLNKTVPNYNPTFTVSPGAFSIIDTGYAARRE